MSSSATVVKSTLSSLLALAALMTSITGTMVLAAQEKCYGVVKAGMNDCQTAGHSCAGSATKDGQGDAFILVPKGMCNKLVLGSLKPRKR